MNPGYRDRIEAGRALGEALGHHTGTSPVVLGVARGGVVVGSEVARAVEGDLDVVVAAKIGAPLGPELAIGAVAADGRALLDDSIVSRLGVTPDDVAEQVAAASEELRRRTLAYRGGSELVLADRRVIVVDDGIATGATLRAVLRYVRSLDPELLVVGAPVGAPQAVDLLAFEADEVVCPLQPDRLGAVGRWYEDFAPVSDETVMALLRA
ncbi:MAG TPA: phosphoribosyltransferase family protein [Acidimicrobiia bacterium]|nr:phosphoribosyltransferase family protein [Acidimicrobiia bacterium]